MTPLLAVSLVCTICIGCQWLAWRFKLPAIVLLSIVGLILGPVLHLLDPVSTFGPSLRTIISIAVAIILFEGGLGLRFKELKEMRRAVLQMVLIGAPLGWVLTASACHYIAGISLPVSIVFGGILVVTGPTVILPLLRQARLQPRAAAVLKWEGIVNDPLGALFAVVAFEYFTSPTLQNEPVVGFTVLILRIVVIAALSYLTGRSVMWVFHRGHIPEFLKQPAVLVLVLLTYSMANLLQDEGGLIAVTVLGITLANSDLRNLDEMRRFKEYLSLLLVSLVFILITATLRWTDVALLDWRAGVFIAVLLLILRPLTVMLSTVNSGMTREELLFVGWIAPRGIVCAAVSGLFGPQLIAHGYADADVMIPLAFAIVFATVIGHGFTLRPWGRKLGLVYHRISGLLMVGCNPFTVELAQRLQELNIPVLLADSDWHQLRLARQAGVPLHYGEVLSEDASLKLEIERFGTLLVASENPAYNALVAAHFAHIIGTENLYRIAVNAPSPDDNKASTATLRVQPLLKGLLHDDLLTKIRAGWKIKTVRVSEEFTFRAFMEVNVEAVPILSLTDRGITLYGQTHDQPAESGHTLIVLVPPK